jgi:hypothetical protein
VAITGRDAARGENAAAAAIRRESGADSAIFIQAEHATSPTHTR